MPAETPPDPWSTNARYQPLVVVFAALCVGVLANRFELVSFPAALVSAVFAWIVWLFHWNKRRDRLAAIAILLAVSMSGAAWHHLRWNVFDRDDLGFLASEVGSPVCVEAVAMSNPRRVPAPPVDLMNPRQQGDQTEFMLRVMKVRDGADWREVSGNVRLSVEGHLLGVHAGDRLQILGSVGRPPVPRNPGDFDLRSFLRTRRQLCSMRSSHPDCVKVTVAGSSWSLRRLLGGIRERCDSILWRNIRRERAGLAAAILIGAREQVDRYRNESFFTTGTVHLLAISGLHVGMLAYFCWMIARTSVVPRNWAVWITLILVVLYSLLTDARPPVTRATILIVIVCLARLIGRQTISFNVLAAAGLVVVLISPAQLFQAGTQLSFLAVATLAYCAPLWMPRSIEDPLDRLIARTRSLPVRMLRVFGNYARRLWLASTCIFLVALPLVMYHYNLVSPAAILLNPLLMIPVAIALFSGFGTLIFGWLIPPVGTLFGWFCDKSLWVIESLIEFAQPIRQSHYFVPSPSLWWIVVFYGALATYVAFPQWRPPRRWCLAMLCAWIAVGSINLDRSLVADKDKLQCTFVAVGHGTGVVVELPNETTFLYDSGRLGSPHIASQSIAEYLWSRRITHLDAVILSHADADHYNALPELLDRVSVGVVYVSPVMFDDETEALASLRHSIEAAGVPIKYLSMSDRLHGGKDVSLEVLHPPENGVLDSDNANSIVLRIDYAGRRILLPGDLEKSGLDDLLAEAALDCDIVMAPHHGSANSRPSDFAQWSTPETIVVSSGFRRGMHAVMREYRDHDARVYHTAEDGAVRIAISQDDLRVQAWRDDGW